MPQPRISAAPPAGPSAYGLSTPPSSGRFAEPTQFSRPTEAPPRRRRSLRGLGIATAALLIAAGVGFSSSIPSLDGAGAAWTSFLPWTLVLLVLLGAAAVIRRAWWGISAVVVALMVWSGVFVPQLIPASVPAGALELTVATQNIGAANTDPAAAARALAATNAGIVAVQEIVGSARTEDAAATSALDDQYDNRARVGTVGVWSYWAMDEPEPLELGLSWARSFRTVVHHPAGDIAVYAVHLPSVRPGYTATRDDGVAELAALVAADPATRVLVMGDLNTATTDPAFDTLTAEVTDSREAVKGGFGFTWPATLPLTRPDHVLGRGLTAISDTVLPAAGSDHRAVLVGLNLQ